jgi:hypothetical protein
MTAPKLSATTMAADIEAALLLLVPLGADEDPIGRHKLALAVARGVLKHLKDQAGCLHVNVKDSSAGTAIDRNVTVEIDTGTL